MTAPDKSNGYEAIAADFINGRGRNASGVGAAEVAEWARTLPDGASVLDLGCGPGVPISLVLIEAGLDVYGVDAAPSMLAAFRRRFPGRPVQCAAAEESDFFGGRGFDGVVSWGLFFLLTEEIQASTHRESRKGPSPGRPVPVHVATASRYLARRADGKALDLTRLRSLPGSAGVRGSGTRGNPSRCGS